VPGVDLADRTLTVNIIGDDKSLQAALNRSTARLNQFDRQTQALNLRQNALGQGLRGASSQLGAGTAALFGSAAFVASSLTTAAITKSVRAASDLNEQIAKNEQVFGDDAEAVKAWAETTGSSFGISQRAALEAAGTFGNLFSTVDINTARSAKMSRALTQLAADLASFNNANVDDVLLAIRSGLIGEAEPLRRYGVLLSETRVQQEALAETGKKNVKALTDQEKALARYRIILQDTVPAQGDFERTSGGLANQQRILSAEIEDLSASMGNFFIPAVTGAVGILNVFVGSTNDAIEAARKFRAFFHDNETIEGWNDAVQDAGDSVIDFGKKVRDQIPGMEHFLALRNRFVGGGGEPNVAPELSPPPHSFPGRQRPPQVDTQTQNGQAVVDAIERQVARQKDLNNQLADSEKRAAHLRDLIRADPDNVKLQARLRRELELQSTLRKQIAAANKAAADDAERSAKAAKDEAAAAAAITRERERQAALRRQEQRRSRQFLALGLTAEGDTPTPGVGALSRRAERLEDQIKGTVLDTAKTRSQLRRIARVLSGAFGAVGRDVRQAILRMLNDISDALNGKSGGGALDRGNLTKFRVVNTSQILAGLGLSEEETMQLRRRLSRLGPGWTIPQPTTTGGAFGFATGGDGRSPRVGGGNNVIINGNVVVYANDVDQFRRSLEKRQQRHAGVRSGPNATRRKN